MYENFKKSLDELNQARDAEEIARIYLEVIQNFSADSMMIMNLQEPKYTPKIKERILKEGEDMLLEAGINMMEGMTTAKPSDLKGISARFNAAFEMLLVRTGENRTDITDDQKKKLWHTSGMVSRHFRTLSLPQFGAEAHVRAQHEATADKAKQIIPMLKELKGKI